MIFHSRKTLLFAVLTGSMATIFNAIGQNTDYNVVPTATPFLTISPDSRSSALGDAGVATTPDLNSQFWNPAKFPFYGESFGVSFSYTPWLRQLVNDIGLFYATGFYKLDDMSAVSASIKYFSLGDITWTDVTGNEQGTISPNEFAIDAAYSRKFSDYWSGAVAFRYIRSDLSGGVRATGGSNEFMYPGKAFAADVATYYSRPIYMNGSEGLLNIGLNFSNIGSKISYDENATSMFLPATMRLGASYVYNIDDYNAIAPVFEMSKLLVPTPGGYATDATEDRKIRDEMSPIKAIFKSFSDAPGGSSEELKEVMYSVGAEYIYDKMFFLRGGYFHEDASKGNRKFFSVGAGLHMNAFGIDFSYLIPTDNQSPLANTLRFSLLFGVNGLGNILGTK